MSLQDNDLARRILSDIDNAFQHDPQIDEFDIIPVPHQELNRSPVIIIEHKLGLELWCVKQLYTYCCFRWSECRRRNRQNADILLSLSRFILLINPNDYSVWNARKLLVTRAQLTPTDDLRFCDLVLGKHPKSPESFWHRKWLLSMISASLNSGVADSPHDHCGASNTDADSPSNKPIGDPPHSSSSDDALVSLVRHELEICTQAADRYPSNYNAWSHRIHVMDSYCPPSLLKEELSRSRYWVSGHVSDHSGFHYRQYLIEKLSRCQHQIPLNRFPIGDESVIENSERAGDVLCGCHCALLHDELKFVSSLMELYREHESIWYHRRFVVASLFACSCESGRENRNALKNGELTYVQAVREAGSERDGVAELRHAESERDGVHALRHAGPERVLITYEKWLGRISSWHWP